MTSKDSLFAPSNKYKVIIAALENGVFNIEGRTSETVVPLTDNMIKFENLKPNQRTCYKYNIPEQYKEDNLMVNSNVIKGNVRLFIAPNSIPRYAKNFPIQTTLDSKASNFELPVSTRTQLNSKAGIWFICVESKQITAFYTLQVFLNQFSQNNKVFQKNLSSLLKSDNLEDHNLINKRILSQEAASVKNEITAAAVTPRAGTTSTATDNIKGLPINGAGVAGIASFILFLITLLIGLTCLDGIFVSTKFVEHPLILGKVEF
jgi:hypothetical protein